MSRIKEILKVRDYSEAIRIYTNKGLINQVSTEFGLKPNELRGLIHRLIQTGKGEAILDAMRKYTPNLAD